MSNASPEGSNTTPPASRTIIVPATQSHGPPNPISKNPSSLPIATPHMFIAHDPEHRTLRDFSTNARTRPIIASTVFPSLCTPISVPISAFPRVRTALHEIFFPFKNAPRPRTAVNISSDIGLKTTPTVGSPPSHNPTDTQLNGYPCTKFVVPSSGSTYQHLTDVVFDNSFAPLAACVSSPTTSSSGNASRSALKTKSSHSLSVAVTRSTAPLYSTLVSFERSRVHARAISAPATRAARSATRNSRS
mmetsp:Transcript_4734/g.18127  ORF Transcript_4734/g.18127 Transcript_4734/m.18127 type:complete len:247 (+) Transcript_4734:321-1061(+)